MPKKLVLNTNEYQKTPIKTRSGRTATKLTKAAASPHNVNKTTIRKIEKTMKIDHEDDNISKGSKSKRNKAIASARNNDNVENIDLETSENKRRSMRKGTSSKLVNNVQTRNVSARNRQLTVSIKKLSLDVLQQHSNNKIGSSKDKVDQENIIDHGKSASTRSLRSNINQNEVSVTSQRSKDNSISNSTRSQSKSERITNSEVNIKTNESQKSTISRTKSLRNVKGTKRVEENTSSNKHSLTKKISVKSPLKVASGRLRPKNVKITEKLPVNNTQIETMSSNTTKKHTSSKIPGKRKNTLENTSNKFKNKNSQDSTTATNTTEKLRNKTIKREGLDDDCIVSKTSKKEKKQEEIAAKNQVNATRRSARNSKNSSQNSFVKETHADADAKQTKSPEKRPLRKSSKISKTDTQTSELTNESQEMQLKRDRSQMTNNISENLSKSRNESQFSPRRTRISSKSSENPAKEEVPVKNTRNSRNKKDNCKDLSKTDPRIVSSQDLQDGQKNNTLLHNTSQTKMKSPLKEKKVKSSEKPMKTQEDKTPINIKDPKVSKSSAIQRKRTKEELGTETINDKKKKSPNKRVHFDTGRNLRHKVIDFAKLNRSTSVDSSDEEEHKHVPIYKQAIKTTEKKVKNVYDLSVSDEKDSDSDGNYDKKMCKLLRVCELRKKQRINRMKKPKNPKIKIMKKPFIILQNKLIRTSDIQHDDDEGPNDPPDFGTPYATPRPSTNTSTKQAIDARIDNNGNISCKDDSYTNFKKPIALNSTMVPHSSPWRPSLVYKNGPHLLSYKKSSLPTFSQDLVLDSSMTQQEKVPYSSTPFRKCVTRRTAKQTSMLNYVNTSRLIEEDEEVSVNCTLFDENLLLSPVKKFAKSPAKAILKDVTNVVYAMNTPEHQSSDVSDFLPSFLKDDTPVVTGKPTRFVIGAKKDQNKKAELVLDKVVQSDVAKSIVFESPVSQTDEAKDAPLVGIFQDWIDVTRPEPSFTYKNKKRRMATHHSTTESEEDEESHEKEAKKKKKRPKNQMTKEEMKNYNEWIKKFNSMCEEVEKFPLEIEKC